MPAPIMIMDPENPDMSQLAEAAGFLAAGGLIAFPTETYYGLAADYANPAALERLAWAKGREEEKPFALILASPAEAEQIAQCPPAAKELMAAHWPGPLTLVMRGRPGLCQRLLGPGGMVGMRVSPHPVAAGLAAALGRAITATSANPAGGAPVMQARGLDPALAARLDLIIDAGPTPGGPASTVAAVDESGEIKVLRPGAVEI